MKAARENPANVQVTSGIYDIPGTMIEITLLGTGSPVPDPNRAGPATLVRAGGQAFLVDCGRGVLQRAAAIGVAATGLSALLLTHLHSDHIADLGDVLITRWITTFAPDPAPFPIIGPPGTAAVVEATLKAFGPDIGYRIAHHDDLTAPPPVEVHEYTEGPVWDREGASIRVAPTDHRPVAPTIGFRIEAGGASVVLAGDTVPCESLDELASGAGALVHTVVRKELIAPLPAQRMKDICDYHSSVQEAAATARRAGVGTLVLTHYVPTIAPGQEEQWRELAATEFDGRIELGDDLHRVEVAPAG
jgi:ribonuclease Z